MVYAVLCPGTPEGSTCSGSDLKCLRRRATAKVSSDRVVVPGIKLRTPGYKVSDLSTTPCRPLKTRNNFFFHLFQELAK